MRKTAAHDIRHNKLSGMSVHVPGLFSLAAASVGGISLLTLPLVLALTLGDRVTRTDAD